jgi:IMP dehydrogenase
VAEVKDPAKVTLGDIMSSDLITVKASDGIDYVAKLMAEKGIRRVLVLREGRVVGIITSRTMLARMNDYVNRVSRQIARFQAPRA